MSAQPVDVLADLANVESLYGVDLTTTRAAVIEMQRKASLWDSIQEARRITADDPADAEWKRYAHINKIAAIKACRAAHGLSLSEARDSVEAYLSAARGGQ